MKSKTNDCYTYFLIRGDFDTKVVLNALNLKADRIINKGELRKDGKSVYEFSAIELCTDKNYDVITENQIKNTVSPLLDKIDVLIELKQKYGLSYVIVIVPTVNSKNSTPALAPSLKTMGFCVKTGTEIDIDLYVL